MQKGKTILTSYFDWKGRTITAQSSMFSGKEWVYVEEQLVSKKSNWRFKSTHEFAIDDDNLAITFDLLARGMLQVNLLKNGKSVDEDIVKLWSIKSLKIMAIAFVFGVLSGALTIKLALLYGVLVGN